jgi:hypothetical protein
MSFDTDDIAEIVAADFGVTTKKSARREFEIRIFEPSP